jgi:hypothetical protein
MPSAPVVKIREGLAISWWNIAVIQRTDDKRKYIVCFTGGGPTLDLTAEEGQRLIDHLVDADSDISVQDTTFTPAAAQKEAAPGDRFSGLVRDDP